MLAEVSTAAVAAIVSIFSASVGIIGIIAAAATVARSTSIKANLELLRGERDDYKAGYARLEGINLELQKRLARAEEEKSILVDLATGRPDLDALTREIRSLKQDIQRATKGGESHESSRRGSHSVRPNNDP